MLSINFGKANEHCQMYCHGGTIDGTELKGMAYWVGKRIEKYLCDDILNSDPQAERVDLLSLRDLLTPQEIMNILSCLPQGMLDKSREYRPYNQTRISYTNAKGTRSTTAIIPLLFNYKAFREHKESIYNGFTLASQLGVSCCPYCNRNYTTTHQTYFIQNNGNSVQKRVYPEFDHFYGQAEYSVLGVSFYNLVPSCTICNTHYKNNRDSSRLFHPYTLNDPEAFKFHGFPKNVASLYGAGNEISLSFRYNCDPDTETSLRNSHEFFGIKDIYDKCHGDLIKDIIYKKLAFGERYMLELSRTYGISFEDSYRIVFETHFENESINMRPFTKLKKDIFENKDL